MSTKSRFALNGKTRDSYLELVLEFPLASIRSDSQLREASEMIDRIFARGDLNPGQELYVDALSDLVAAYEDEYYEIGPASDADMLRHFMDARGVTQTQLSRDTKIPKSSISEVLAAKKPLSRQMIGKLANYFKVDPSVLTANFSAQQKHRKSSATR